jgi:drug/metabolite transporter (DMT)-like permease
MVRVLVAMIVACTAAAAGQILVRHGMQQVGALDTWAPGAVLSYFWRALCNPSVIGGTVLNAIFYFLFLAVLSWTEVTVALPLTALEYAVAAVLAVLVLKEVVPPLRWADIVLVILGVALVSVERPAGDEHPTNGASVEHQRDAHRR